MFAASWGAGGLGGELDTLPSRRPEGAHPIREPLEPSAQQELEAGGKVTGAFHPALQESTNFLLLEICLHSFSSHSGVTEARRRRRHLIT